MNTKVAIYARVSTVDKGQDVDLQLTDLRSYVQSRGFALHKEYIDKESGAKDAREALNDLLNDCRKRRWMRY